MGRKFVLQDEDWGSYKVYAITEYEGGKWEREWEPFRTIPELMPITELFSRVSYSSFQDALRGHVMPLIRELGPEPAACLIKVGLSKRLGEDPNPDSEVGEDQFEIDTLALEVYELWRDDVYIIVVPDTDEFI